MALVEYETTRDGVVTNKLGSFKSGDIDRRTLAAQRGARFAVVRVKRLIHA